MDLYCIQECPKGKDFLKKNLEDKESIFDAVFDTKEFIEDCEISCPYKIRDEIGVNYKTNNR